MSARDSGIGTSECGSAVKGYFDNFFKELHSSIQSCDMDDDPTIDLESAECMSPINGPGRKTQRVSKMITSETKKQVANRQPDYQIFKRTDLNLKELDVLVRELDENSSYGEKLAQIMLRGLEKTLTSDIYHLFLQGRLPDNWCPIIKMNNDNAPYIEFLIKSDLADQDPFSQMNGYTAEHMALSKYVLTRVQSISKYVLPQIKNHETRSSVEKSSSICESPSTRVLPPRACKSQKKQRLNCSGRH